MRDWYRRSLPDRRLQLVFCALLVGMDLFAVGVWLSFSAAYGAAALGERTRLLLAPAGLFCACTTILIAVCRIERYPAVGSDYAEYLSGTPWTADCATPFGPWHPVRRDAGLLSVLGLLSAAHLGLFFWWAIPDFVQSAQPLLVPAIAVGTAVLPAVLFVLTWSVCGYVKVAGGWKYAVLVPLLTLGLLYHLGRDLGPLVAGPLALAVFVAGSLAVYRRMRSQLSRIPRGRPDRRNGNVGSQLSLVTSQLKPDMPDTLGTRLLDQMSDVRLPLSAVVGTLVAVPEWTPGALSLLPFLLLVYGLIHAGIHCDVCGTHLGLAARWSRKQLLIPSFDRAFLPVVWLMLTSTAIIVLGHALHWPPRLTVALAVGAAVWVSLATRVDLHDWSLTAPARFARRPEQRRTEHRRQTSGILNASSHR